MADVEFKKGDQIIVDNFVEQGERFKLSASNVCQILVVGKYDLIVKSNDTSYYPRIFTRRKSKIQVDITIPKINDLVAGITSDLGNKNQEMHVGILEEIRHNNTSSKTAVIREGNKRTSISLSSLIVLEQKNEK